MVVIQEGLARVGVLQEVSLDPSMMTALREVAIRAVIEAVFIEDSHSKTNTLIGKNDVAYESRRRVTNVFTLKDMVIHLFH